MGGYLRGTHTYDPPLARIVVELYHMSDLDRRVS